MKKKLHIHSDCYKWGGSENMISVFLQNKKLNELFDITFSYRQTPEYEAGMDKWIPNTKAKLQPLQLPETFLYKIKGWFPPAKLLAYLLSYVKVGDMLRELQNEKPDILHIINGGYPGAYSCNAMAVAGKLAKIPLITYFLTSTTRDPWWYRPMTWMVRNSVNVFVSASEYLRNHSKFLRKGKYKQWANISNTIKDIEIENPEAVRQKMGIPQDEVVFLCMGDLEKRKGFDRAIDALSQMIEVGTPRSLLIVGDGPENDNLRKQMRSKTKGVYRIFNEVDIHPYSIINAMDVLVVSSIGDEDWPNVILIAMKYGKPCIVSNICGLPEMIGHTITGYIFFNNNELIFYMNNLLHEGRRARMSNNSLLHYDSYYREENIVKQYMNLWG